MTRGANAIGSCNMAWDGIGSKVRVDGKPPGSGFRPDVNFNPSDGKGEQRLRSSYPSAIWRQRCYIDARGGVVSVVDRGVGASMRGPFRRHIDNPCEDSRGFASPLVAAVFSSQKACQSSGVSTSCKLEGTTCQQSCNEQCSFLAPTPTTKRR
jgi:hypothetical protein